ARGPSRVFDGSQDRINGEKHRLLDVWMSHGDKVTALPPGFKVIASNEATPIAGMADEARKFYGVQFHPEVTHTRQGAAILSRFVHEICGCGSDWNMPDYLGEAVEKVRREVGKEEVLLGLSGGVDSAVAAALIHRAIGDRLSCVYVDTGMLRQHEAPDGVREDEEGAHDQVAPQRGGPARDPPPEAPRAPAGSLQGRGTGAGPRPGTPARDGVPASLPRAWPRRAHPRRSETGVRGAAPP